MPRNARTILTLFVLTGLLAYAAVEGTVVGTVLDPSGAAIANARVAIRSEGTNFVRETQTDGTGNYVVPDLAPGSYTVTIEAAGFRRAVYSGLILRVEQKLRVDSTLQVGQVDQTVEVSGQGVLVETDSSSIGQVVDRDRVNRLPLNGRFFLQLALLVPGASLGGVSTRQSANQEGNSVSLNGMRSYSNTYLIDGVDNNSLFNGYYIVSPSVDAIQEFKVQMNAYSAEFGRSAGAQVNVLTRTGTNAFHGSLFEYLRNNVLDANPWFSNSAGITTKVPFRRNQFGGSFGGPALIPKIYNGKDKTFFFFNYEGTRIRQAVTRVSTVPPAAFRAGDFSGQPAIYDPLNVVNGQRQPFANNRLPDSRISNASKFLQQYVPLPLVPGLAGNLTRNTAYKDDTNQVGLRIDQKIGANGQLFGRFFHSPRAVTNPSNFGTPAIGGGGFGSGVVETDGRNLYALGYTHVIRPTLINDFRAGYNRFVWLYFHDNAGRDFAREAGIQGLPTDKDLVGFPLIGITNFTGWGDGAFVPNLTRPDATIHATDSLTWIKGRHTVKGGFDFRWNDRFFLTGSAFRGNFSFNGRYTAATPLGVGNAYADFLLGYASGASRTVGTEYGYSQSRFYHYYVQDDWKVNRRLTLSLGLRYEWNPPYYTKNNRLANFDLNTGRMVYADLSLVPQGLPFPVGQAISRSTINGDKNGFGPRFGFAYRHRGQQDGAPRRLRRLPESGDRQSADQHELHEPALPVQ
ncbi:MAG: carboxypeptidase regulatory-like domain-containing protein [Bryobacteraceae bacterium]